MPKKLTETLTKHTLLLYAGDYTKLMRLHEATGGSAVVRELVRRHINKLEPPINTTEIKGDEANV